MCGPHGKADLGGFNAILEHQPKHFHATFRREPYKVLETITKGWFSDSSNGVGAGVIRELMT